MSESADPNKPKRWTPTPDDGTAKDWDRGIRKVGNSRFYPDGRKAEYTRGVTIVNFSPGSETMPYPAVTVAQVNARVSARYLSLQERETIRANPAATSTKHTGIQAI